MENLVSTVIVAQAGDQKAFDRIISQTRAGALHIACNNLQDSYLAEDAVQEAFIETYQTLSQLRHPEAFPGWFRLVVLKHCDRLKRSRNIQTIPYQEDIVGCENWPAHGDYRNAVLCEGPGEKIAEKTAKSDRALYCRVCAQGDRRTARITSDDSEEKTQRAAHAVVEQRADGGIGHMATPLEVADQRRKLRANQPPLTHGGRQGRVMDLLAVGTPIRRTLMGMELDWLID